MQASSRLPLDRIYRSIAVVIEAKDRDRASRFASVHHQAKGQVAFKDAVEYAHSSLIAKLHMPAIANASRSSTLVKTGIYIVEFIIRTQAGETWLAG